MSKINFKKYYFNIFLNKKHFKTQHLRYPPTNSSVLLLKKTCNQTIKKYILNWLIIYINN